MQHGHGSEHLAAVALAMLGQLSDFWKLVLVVAAIFSAGGGVALAAVNFKGLPARVGALEQRASAHDSVAREITVRIGTLESAAANDRRRIEGKLDRLLCLAEAQRGERSYESCVD
jgi:hypothetical protein